MSVSGHKRTSPRSSQRCFDGCGYDSRIDEIPNFGDLRVPKIVSLRYNSHEPDLS